MRTIPTSAVLAAVMGVMIFGQSLAGTKQWQREWPKTDFTKHLVPYEEIMSGGVRKDQIPSIDKPEFMTVGAVAAAEGLAPTEPVVGLTVNGTARAYPLSVLIWHEIVNETSSPACPWW